MPIIVVSARSEDVDKIGALDAGADDYLTKSFSVGELLARIRTTLRRLNYQSPAQGQEPSTFQNGDLRIDYTAGIAYLGDGELHLTPIEYKLLCLLSHNVDKVLTHSFILHEVWSNNHQAGLASLRVFMGTLRKKIEPDPVHPRNIQTHIGVGYRMMRVTDEYGFRLVVRAESRVDSSPIRKLRAYIYVNKAYKDVLNALHRSLAYL